MKLSGPQLEVLCKLIRDAFDEDSLDQALTFKLSEGLDSFARPAAFKVRVFELANDFNRRESVTKLAAALAEANPAPGLISGLDALLKPPAQSWQRMVLSKLPTLPFVYREKLRSTISEIAAGQHPYRVVSIDGEPASGKTYSWEMIQRAALETGTEVTRFKAGRMSLEKFWRMLGGRLGLVLKLPDDEQVKLVSRMEADLSDNPTADRMAERFGLWLAESSSKTAKKCWLVFDDLKGGHDELTSLMVPTLLKAAAAGNFGQMLIILLGQDTRNYPVILGRATHELLEGVKPADIRQYILDCAKEYGRQFSEAQLTAHLASIVAGAQWPYDHENMDIIHGNLVAFLEAEVLK